MITNRPVFAMRARKQNFRREPNHWRTRATGNTMSRAARLYTHADKTMAMRPLKLELSTQHMLRTSEVQAGIWSERARTRSSQDESISDDGLELRSSWPGFKNRNRMRAEGAAKQSFQGGVMPHKRRKPTLPVQHLQPPRGIR